MAEKKNVLITGGSRGLGAAIATRLGRSGYHIWLNYQASHQAAAAVKQDIEDHGGSCRLLPFDIGNEQQVEEVLVPLLESHPLYGLVHNAGITRDSLVAMMKREEWDQVLNVHLTAFYLLVKHAVKNMIPAREGRIVAISSVSGETGQAGQVNYSAAKAGLIGAAKALAREVARRNILVNVVSPGLIDTDMSKDVAIQAVLPLIPLNRIGRPEEVAGAIEFLLSDDGSYITGQVISINGGLYM